MAAGFSLTEAGDLRSPRTIVVVLADSNPLAGDVREHDLDGATAQFRISELGAGSGGVEYELVATKEDAGAFVVVTAIKQTESTEPDFTTAWAVLAKARVER